MSKGIGGPSPWMEVAPALLVPARTRSSKYPGLETIAEDQEAEDGNDELQILLFFFFSSFLLGVCRLFAPSDS
ncbi:hypothetical protein ACJRO7_008815 [Eucalyptus globulus]|uniref:Uncharacterized protein n=1 Tax=Eucalyptus globulus TaxID=34317 RepID=A0ABD3ITM7_EUCGL